MTEWLNSMESVRLSPVIFLVTCAASQLLRMTEWLNSMESVRLSAVIFLVTCAASQLLRMTVHFAMNFRDLTLVALVAVIFHGRGQIQGYQGETGLAVFGLLEAYYVLVAFGAGLEFNAVLVCAVVAAVDFYVAAMVFLAGEAFRGLCRRANRGVALAENYVAETA